MASDKIRIFVKLTKEEKELIRKRMKDAGIQIADYGWTQNYPNNYSGHDPTGLTATIGKAALWIQAQYMARAFKVFKEDENVLKWHEEMQKGW